MILVLKATWISKGFASKNSQDTKQKAMIMISKFKTPIASENDCESIIDENFESRNEEIVDNCSSSESLSLNIDKSPIIQK